MLSDSWKTRRSAYELTILIYAAVIGALKERDELQKLQATQGSGTSDALHVKPIGKTKPRQPVFKPAVSQTMTASGSGEDPCSCTGGPGKPASDVTAASSTGRSEPALVTTHARMQADGRLFQPVCADSAEKLAYGLMGTEVAKSAKA